MLGGELTHPPPIVDVEGDTMSGHTSQAQTRIAIADGESIVLDAEAALDEVYGALANRRRRRVLSVLTQEGTPIDVRALARQVTIREATDASDMVTEERIERVHASLYHNHLPKLADLDLIAYDAEDESVDGIADTIESVTL